MEVICITPRLKYKKIKKTTHVTMLGFGLCTQALTYERVHTQDTKWKESAFQANNPFIHNRELHHFCIGAHCTPCANDNKITQKCTYMIDTHII